MRLRSIDRDDSSSSFVRAGQFWCSYWLSLVMVPHFHLWRACQLWYRIITHRRCELTAVSKTTQALAMTTSSMTGMLMAPEQQKLWLVSIRWEDLCCVVLKDNTWLIHGWKAGREWDGPQPYLPVVQSYILLRVIICLQKSSWYQRDTTARLHRQAVNNFRILFFLQLLSLKEHQVEHRRRLR